MSRAWERDAVQSSRILQKDPRIRHRGGDQRRDGGAPLAGMLPVQSQRGVESLRPLSPGTTYRIGMPLGALGFSSVYTEAREVGSGQEQILSLCSALLERCSYNSVMI